MLYVMKGALFLFMYLSHGSYCLLSWLVIVNNIQWAENLTLYEFIPNEQ
jgi:hypothetical protein